MATKGGKGILSSIRGHSTKEYPYCGSFKKYRKNLASLKDDGFSIKNVDQVLEYVH